MAHFDENNPHYRCCCGHCHVKTGAIIIGVIELVFALLYIVRGTQALIDDHRATANIINFVIGAIFLIAVILLIIGVIKIRKNFIIPHLIWQIIFIALALIIMVTTVVAYFVGGDLKKSILGASEQLGEHSIISEAAGKVSEETGVGKTTGDIMSEGQQEGKEGGDVLKFLLGLIVTLVQYGIVLILEIWFFVVVLGAYRFCRDKENFDRAHWEGVPLEAKA